MSAVPLTRPALARRASAAAPVRIVHIGLGAFARAHQAWYTYVADTGKEWGIAAFTGTSSTAAELLGPQGGLYTLVERSARGDRAEVISSVSEVRDGGDVERLTELLRAPQTAIVTLTITEAGYRLAADGRPDRADPVVASDIAALQALRGDDVAEVSGALARLVAGLRARAADDAGPLAVVPCDNIPANGALTRGAVLALAGEVPGQLREWIETNVSFISTSVDRITPRLQADERRQVAELTGWDDAAPVVTEPFTDWILSGEFPAGRPEWERAGARFVENVEPFERRKLWMLNGAHSLLAYLGRQRGHDTIAQAISDPVCRETVDALWDDAAAHLPADLLELDSYRQALLTRFDNPRIEHRLAQIGEDGVAKLRIRIAPLLLAERRAGRSARAETAAVAAWVSQHLAGRGLPDTQHEAIARARSVDDPVRGLLSLLDGRLADPFVLDSVRDAVRAASLA